MIHVFNVQASQGAERCYLNLGTQLDFFLPAGKLPEKTLEYDCMFRRRIDPPAPLQGWPFGADDTQALATIDAIDEEWQRQAQPFFHNLAHWPDDFSRMIDTAAFPMPAHRALDLAMIAIKLGDGAQARTLAQAGLENCPERAASLRAKLKRLLA